MKKGQTKDLDLTFPEEYSSEELAGQEVVFKVTLQSFKRAPELTDDWAAKNTDCKTAEEYRKEIAPHWKMRQKQAHRIHSVRLHGIQYFLLLK